jgi:UDP-galactopyranose mutase
MPFAINASTEFISPTKTPEFLAAGKRVISTKIHDVVYPYGEKGLVGIAQDAESFIRITEKYLDDKNTGQWLNEVDEFLSGISWDKTWHDMESKVCEVIRMQKGAEKQLK